MESGTSILCYQCRPFRFLSEPYSFRLYRMDEQCRRCCSQSRKLVVQCGRLAYATSVQDKGTNIANLRQAKARQEEALLLFQQSLLDAGKEVNNALTRWQSARIRIDYVNQQIMTLQEAVRKTELLMQHTSTNYLEVLTARQRLLEAELTQAQDKFEEIQGVIDLYHAVGGR